MKKEAIKSHLLSKEHHLLLNPLAGKKIINNSKKLFCYIDRDIEKMSDRVGIKTPAKAIGVYEAEAEVGVSIKDIFEYFPGVLSRKWLSQSQLIKVCKHFKNWLEFDGYTYFLCKIREDISVNPENPWSNLMVLEVQWYHDDDLAVRLISPLILESKCVLAKKYRIILPKRTKEQKH
jgi:hypothetical protein